MFSKSAGMRVIPGRGSESSPLTRVLYWQRFDELHQARSQPSLLRHPSNTVICSCYYFRLMYQGHRSPTNWLAVLVKKRRRHDDVIKWKHFPRNWPFVREIHRSPVNFPHKGQWRGALMFSLIYAWINDWVNNREAGDLRRQHGHYDLIVMNDGHHTLSLRTWEARQIRSETNLVWNDTEIVLWKKNQKSIYIHIHITELNRPC